MFSWLSWQRKLLKGREWNLSLWHGSQKSPSPLHCHRDRWGRAQRRAVAPASPRRQCSHRDGRGGAHSKHPHEPPFLGTKWKLLEYVKDIFRVCIYWLILFPHTFRRAELTAHLRTWLRKILQLSVFFFRFKSQKTFGGEGTFPLSCFLKHKPSLNVGFFLLRIWV